MIQKLLTLVITFFVVVGNLSAQEKSDEQLVKEGTIRFISYPRNKKNALLYDTINPRGFYQLIQATFSENYTISNIELKGLNERDVQKLRECAGQPLSELSWLESRLGPQSTKNLKTADGKDSVFRDEKVGLVYVYPERETTYFMCRKYDDVVVKEKKVFDSLSRKFIFVPTEIIFRNRLCFSDKPVVTARMNLDLIYQFGKAIYVPVESDKSTPLIQSLETFLLNAETLFGTSGCYQIIDYHTFFDFQREELKLFGEKRHHGMGHDFVAKDLINNEAFIVEKRDTSILANGYGEDSLVFNNKSNEYLLEYQINIDTFYYVKSGFEQLYELHYVFYDRREKQWKEYTHSIFATKKVFSGRQPTIVYEMADEPGDRPFVYTTLRYPSVTSYIKKQYVEMNNPLYKYLRAIPQTSFAQFSWEEKLYNHTFSGVEVSIP